MAEQPTIQAAVTLLKKQFPDQSYQRIFSGNQATQTLLISMSLSQSHWVCASNIFSSPEVCNIYDSMPPIYTSTLTCQVEHYRCQSPSFNLRHINVQHQSRETSYSGANCLPTSQTFQLKILVQKLWSPTTHLRILLLQGQLKK